MVGRTFFHVLKDAGKIGEGIRIGCALSSSTSVYKKIFRFHKAKKSVYSVYNVYNYIIYLKINYI